MSEKDQAVEREAARGRLVNIEFEMIRESYAHGYVLCRGPGASIEVVDKCTNASCKVFLHDMGPEPDKEFIKMIQAAGAALDSVLRGCRPKPEE